MRRSHCTTPPTQGQSRRHPRRNALFAFMVFTSLSWPTSAHANVSDAIPAIDAIFAFATPDTPGCAVGVSQRGEVLVDRTYGLADVERGVALTPDAAFDIGSTHKQFVAAAIFLLVQDGRLTLSDDVRAYLPELNEYGHTITVDHLLTHTSGIRDWVGLLPLAEDGVDVLELILRQQDIDFVPGAEWRYSNSGYVLLKEIVARVSGMSFADYARTRLFEPLGMASSAYVADVLQYTGERALAYAREGEGWRAFMRLGNERGGGTVVSTAGDLLIWNDALTEGRLGTFITEKLHEPAVLNSGRMLTYARGLNVEVVPGERLAWHSGGAAGYSSWLGRFMENGLSVAVLCNFEPVSATALARRVSDLFLPPVDASSSEPVPAAATEVDVKRREGLFFDERTGQSLRLRIQDGALNIAGQTPLVPVSVDRFVPPRTSLWVRSQDAFELTFVSDDVLELTSMEGDTTRFLRAEPWTPTTADLEAVEGRYASEDLGRVFEMVPLTDGLVFRFEAIPERALELRPVARDTYMQGMATVRFLRNAEQTITGFEYSTPAVRGLRFTRLGQRSVGSPTPVREGLPPAAASGPAPRLAGLVGEYEMGPGRTISITHEDGQLYGEPTGNAKRPLLHTSGASFSVGSSDSGITITFTLDADGRATALVMLQDGVERTLSRVR